MPREGDLEWRIAKLLQQSFTYYAQGFNGMLCHAELGASSTVHDRFQEWEQEGLFRAHGLAGLIQYEEVQGIEWEWQSVDGAMTKAPLGKGATGPNPTDRAKSGVKRGLLTDGADIPLAIVIDGANRHDSKLLCATLDGIVIARASAK